MNKLEPEFCEACPDPLDPDDEIVQISEKVKVSPEQASGVMGMFTKTHIYHPEHVPAIGNYVVTYRGPSEARTRRDRIEKPRTARSRLAARSGIAGSGTGAGAMTT